MGKDGKEFCRDTDRKFLKRTYNYIYIYIIILICYSEFHALAIVRHQAYIMFILPKKIK